MNKRENHSVGPTTARLKIFGASRTLLSSTIRTIRNTRTLDAITESKKGLHSKKSMLRMSQDHSKEHSGQMNADVRHIARQRVQTLFSLAFQIFEHDPALAQQYVDTARKISMAAKIRLPRRYRRQVCRHCKSLILPGINCRVRIRQLREPHIVTTCLNCGKHTRMLLSKEEDRLKS
jgi:ribonuclease P protein subunit RPR2